MFNHVSKNRVFSRYNTSVITSFVLIVLVALSIASYRYFVELSVYEKSDLTSLVKQAELLDNKLENSVNALLSFQQFANYYLAYPDELTATVPDLVQDSGQFYLKTPQHDVITHRNNLSNNITGVSDIGEISDSFKQELAMANALTPAFITAKKTNKAATWFYYVSLNRFVSLYPWVSRNSWRFSDRMLNNSHMNNIKLMADTNKEPIWSVPYIDSAGKGLTTALGLGVYKNKVLAGAVVIEMSLASLHEHLPAITQPNTELVLLNKNNVVLVHKDNTEKLVSKNSSWQEVMPKALANLTDVELAKIESSAVVGSWFIQKQVLPINGWVLLKYQPRDQFLAPIFNRFLYVFTMLFLGLLTLLVLVYIATHKTFIKPTQKFISHIEHCSQGNPGKIKPTNDWLHWFKIVEDIFGQNRSLLQRLTEHNTALDIRVSEKTQEQQNTIIKHRRDYALLRSVMDAIPEYILFNDLDGNLVGCNKAFEKFIAKKEINILGHKAEQLVANKLGQGLTEISKRLKLQEISQKIIETVDNTYDIFSTHIYNDTGQAIGTIDVVRDVTTQCLVQAALELAKDQAEYANKAKSQFLANMSHEIRTPINAIQGMISLLNKSTLTSYQIQHLDNASGASQSLLYLVDELLDLAKIESGKMTIIKELCNIDSIIDKAVKLNVGIINRKQLRLVIDIESTVPLLVVTDEMRLVQVLTNLLNNSVKFTHEGEIKLSVETIAKSDDNVLVRFSIKDTGIGISKENQKHLFEAFRQADESMTREYGGSGLGLSICQQIVNLLSGDIVIASELNQGSEFSFVLPFNLTKTSHYIDTKPLTICCVDVELPMSVINAINLFGWPFIYVKHLDEIDQQVHADQLVVIVNDNLLCSKALEHIKHPIELLCVHQQMAHDINIEERLLTLSMPYMLLESPLYRQMLLAINQNMRTIRDVAANKINGSISQVEENLEGVKVLLVEDNLVNQLVAKELLKNMKAHVVIAEDGQVALNMLKLHDIDLVLMDIQMPVMDGLTAAKLIRKQSEYSNLPIIAMTAHAGEKDRENSLAAGMDLHISKPVQADLLLKSILGILKKYKIAESNVL